MNQDHDDRKRDKVHWQDALPRWLFAALLATLLLMMGAVLYKILWSSPVVGSPATESMAVTRASERLIQMVQWTISTILLIGGALIGLNWYQSNQRYQNDKETLQRMNDFLTASMDRSEKHVNEQVQAMREMPSQIEERVAQQVTDLLSERMQRLFEERVNTQGAETPSALGDPNGSRTGDASQTKPSWGALIDNVLNYQAGNRLTAQSNRFLHPNPFRSMDEERRVALETILQVLRSAKENGDERQALLDLGAKDIWKIFPLVSVEFESEGDEIRELLNQLNVPRPESSS